MLCSRAQESWIRTHTRLLTPPELGLGELHVDHSATTCHSCYQNNNNNTGHLYSAILRTEPCTGDEDKTKNKRIRIGWGTEMTIGSFWIQARRLLLSIVIQLINTRAPNLSHREFTGPRLQSRASDLDSKPWKRLCQFVRDHHTSSLHLFVKKKPVHKNSPELQISLKEEDAFRPSIKGKLVF